MIPMQKRSSCKMQNSMNNRANIMYFIEHLCDMAKREGHVELIRMMQRDILRIIDAVAPADGSGAANVKVVRRVLSGLRQKEMLTAETVVELEECLKERDTAQDQSETSPAYNDTSRPGFGSSSASRPNGVGRLDKRQIEQRIEEDRERHKRLRENIWAVRSDGNEEFEKLWDDASDIGEDDFLAAQEDAAERKRAEIVVE